MAWATAVLAVIIIVVLLTPFRFGLRVRGQGRPAWAGEATWLAGAVRFGWSAGQSYVVVGRWRRPLKKGARRPPKPQPPAGEKISKLLSIRKKATPARRKALIGLLGDVWAAIRLQVRGEMICGFEDPALTAWLQAAYCMGGWDHKFPGLRLDTDFARTGWWGEAEINWSVKVFDLIRPLTRFIYQAFVRPTITKYGGGRAQWQGQG